MVTQAQKEANTKWRKKVYDQIPINTPKGKREIIKEYALKRGITLNAYLNLAIDNQLKKDGFDPSESEAEPLQEPEKE